MSELLQRRLLLAQLEGEQAAGWGSVTVLPTPVRYRLRPRLHDRKAVAHTFDSATLENEQGHRSVNCDGLYRCSTSETREHPL